MKPTTIKLAHRLKLTNIDEAKKFKLDSHYGRYFETIKRVSGFQELNNSSNTPIQMFKELNGIFEKTESPGFSYALNLSKPFYDVSHTHAFELSFVNLNLRSFDIEKNELELDVFCITTELNLIDTIGTYAIIEQNRNGAAGWTKILTVALTENTTIYEIKADHAGE